MTGDERTTDATSRATDPTVRALAHRLLNELATSLTARGFRVVVEPHHWTLIAVNEVTPEPPPPGYRPEPLDLAFQPARLVQRVTLALTAEDHPTAPRALYWHWQWAGPTRDAPPEYEPMCPADAIAEASERLTRVLRLAVTE